MHENILAILFLQELDFVLFFLKKKLNEEDQFFWVTFRNSSN